MEEDGKGVEQEAGTRLGQNEKEKDEKREKRRRRKELESYTSLAQRIANRDRRSRSPKDQDTAVMPIVKVRLPRGSIHTSISNGIVNVKNVGELAKTRSSNEGL